MSSRAFQAKVAALMVVIVASVWLLNGDTGGNVLSHPVVILGSAVAVAMTAFAGYGATAGSRAAWWSLAAALTAWTAAQVLTSAAVAALVIFGIGACVALLLVRRRPAAHWGPRLLLDGLIVAGSFFIVWSTLLSDSAEVSGATPRLPANVLVDLVVLTVAAVVLLGAGARVTPTIALLSAGLSSLVLADAVAAYLSERSSQGNGAAAGITAMVGLVLIVMAAATSRWPALQRPRPAVTRDWPAVWIPLTPLMLALVVAALGPPFTVQSAPVRLLGLLLVVAVLVRQFALLSAEPRLAGNPTGASPGGAPPAAHFGDSAALRQRAQLAAELVELDLLGRADSDERADEVQLLGELRRAIGECELTLLYQPKCDLRTGALVGVEALVRWPHPQRGLLGPDAFLPLVRRTGLIGVITELVIQTAFDDARRWQEEAVVVPVAVNLFAPLLSDLDLPAKIANALSDHGLSPAALTVEITEDLIIENLDRTTTVMKELRRLGIRISVDDFGSGYSALSYLRDLAVDEIKLDRDFIIPILSDDRAALVVRAVIDLAHGLGLTVVAEGVENVEIADRLREFGCDIGQGYHYGRPLAPEEVVTLALPRSDQPGPRSDRPIRRPPALRRGARPGRRQGRPTR